MKIKIAVIVAIVLFAILISFAMSQTSVASESPQKSSARKTKVDVRYDKKTPSNTLLERTRR